jgi:hypothetical protein
MARPSNSPPNPLLRKYVKQKKLKTLIFDVETKPVLAWIWRTGKQYITHDQIKRDQKFDIICICWKWDGESKIHSLDWGIKKQNSYDMIEKFSKVIETADVCIAHNADKFDIKQINTQRLLHGQGPIAWPTSEDTLKQIRKYFALPSYSLDYLSKLLTGAGKDRMEFRDWIDIVADKKPKALKKMIKYCKRDVLLLQKSWDKIKAFCEPKASAAITSGNLEGCPRCSSLDKTREGYKILRAGKYQRYQCKSCGFKWRDGKKS